ncbi:S-phase kinase-associated protein 1-like [Contarinia nasturtii]|uniref:S-phase kinase-associated protein 1-like n=1 Tax=Contarinia nasturtii TaxID=265458 RepID=UPI0012D4224D|nr:S-phase kinase-associated protein 1-like [Contarinia nasturtii]XP_031638858.1 S-phase kinase-associated protein 1-like [Contarinia nasturtii]
MSSIKLISSEGEIFETDIEVAMTSKTIKNMLEGCVIDGDENSETIIPLSRVSSNILRLVLEWAKHHLDEPIQIAGNKEKSDIPIPEWDANFLKIDQDQLFELIMAANYLQIKELLYVSSKTVANMMKGKSPEEIRQIFGIESELSPEEEKKVQQENEWCKEN